MTTFNVYRRQTVDDTPVAIATGLTSQDYSDATAVNGESYLYSIGAIKEGVEKISDEINIIASYDIYWNNVIFYAPFNANFNDQSNLQVQTTNVGSCTIDDADGAVGTGCLNTPLNGMITAPIDAQFGTDDFTIDFYAKTNSTTPAWWGLLSVEAAVGQDNSMFTMTIYDQNTNSGLAWFSSNASSWNIWNLVSVNAINDGNWHHWELDRSGNHLYLFRDGLLVANVALASDLSLIQKGIYTSIGAKDVTAASGAACKFQHFRITKGVARHTSNFTPPTSF